MAVTAVGTPAITRATSGSVTATWGTGQNRTAGNVLWAFVSAGGSTASAAAISTPAGWTQVAVTSNTATTANAWTAVYRKIAAGSDSAPAFTATLTGTTAMTATLLELSGCLNAGPVQAFGVYRSGGASGTLSAMTAGTGLPAVGGAYAVSIFCQEAAAATNTWNAGSGWTNLVNDGATSSVLHTAVDWQAPSTSSATAETAHWTTNTSAFGTGITIVICPPSGLEAYAADVPSTTVSSGGTGAPAAGTVETWTVASSTGFPAVSNGVVPPTRYHVADPVLPSENIEVIEQISSTSWLVVRGADGTTPVAHTGGFTVYQVVNAGTFGDVVPVYNVRSRRFGAAGDGSTDDYAAIQLALNTCAANGGGIVDLPAGVYLTSNMLQAGSNTLLRGAGKGVTVIRMKSGSWSSVAQAGGINGVAALMTAQNGSASYVAVRDLSVDGNQTGITALPSWATGGTSAGDNVTNSPLHLNNVSNLEISNVEVINPIGYAVYLQSCVNFTVRGCRVISGQTTATQGWGLPSQQDGVHLDGVSYGAVDRCYIDTGATGVNTGDDAIALQSLSGVIHDIVISGNTIRSDEAGVDLAISGNDIYDVSIVGNTIWQTEESGVVFQPFTSGTATAHNIAITGNTFRAVCVNGNSQRAAVALLDYSINGFTAAAAWSGVTISGNTIEDVTNANAYGIYARYGTDVTVTGNTIRTFAGLVGITIGDNISAASLPVTQFTVASNTVDMSTSTVSGCVGVLVYDSGQGAVSGNTLIGPGPNASDRIGISPTQASATNLCQVINATNNTMVGWDFGVQEFNAGGGNPDFNSYAGNLFSNVTNSYGLLGTHSLLPDVEQYVALSSSYTLTSSTSAQKLFNATTNGAITVQGATTYLFECEFDLTALSATSGTFSFGFGGTATLTSVKYQASAQKTAAAGTLATWPSFVATSASATALVAASTTTTGAAILRGILRVNAAGTIIPQVTLSVAAAAVVGANSYFRIWPTAGSNTATNIGNWS